jgi:hypothetical protein
MRSQYRPWCAPLVLLAVLLGASSPPGRASEAAQATPAAQPTVSRGDGRTGLSPTLLGDINSDGIVVPRFILCVAPLVASLVTPLVAPDGILVICSWGRMP